MTLISLICLLALSSSAFGRSTYGSMSYGELPRSINVQLPKADLPLQTQTQTSFQVQPTFVSQGSGYSSNGYGQQMQKSNSGLFLDQISTVQQLTEADIRCKGQRADTIIPLDDGRRYIVCLDEGKGVEQSCPRDLHFHTETQRCERRLGPLDNACVSNPCLNDGQCFPIDTSSYQCKCAPGFDGFNCELDARVCQTQQPCGQAQGTRCQSFRSNAALQYICLHNNDRAYGFSAQQVTPSPCQNIDGAQPLGISEKGFIMCDGERMFIESCPGGTLWDDLTKACVWPDMQGFGSSIRLNEQIKTTGYTQQKPLLTSSTDFQIQTQRPSFDSNLLPSIQTSNYGSAKTFQKSQDLIATPSSSYGSQQWTQKPQEFLQPQIQKPQEFLQQTIQKPQETMQQWTQKPQEFLTVQKPQEFLQVQKPQESMQQWTQKPQEFLQPQIQKPQEFLQQTVQKPQEFLQVQQPVQKMQDFLPSQSYGSQQQQQQQSFQRIQKQPEFRSFQATSSY